MPVLLFLAFTLYPIVSAFIMSFQYYSVLESTWVGLDNYKYALTDPVFWRSMRVTLVYTVGTVPVNVLISLGLAYLVFQLRERARTFFKAALYLPAVTSGVTMSLVWLWILDPTPSGLLNQALGWFGIDNVIWLGSSKTALLSLMLMTYFGSHGPALILYLSAMGGIPKSLYEAADVDAASNWSKLRNITWPLLKPTTLYLLVTGVISSFQVFMNVYLMTQGGPNFATSTIAYLIYQNAFRYFDFGLASAMSFLLAVVIVAVSAIQFKYMSTDVEY
jgi:multiple sugar transport system permease protein